MKNKINLRSWIFMIVIALLSVYVFRTNSKPTLMVSLIIAFSGIFIIGLFSNRYIGSFFGGFVFGGGYAARHLFPEKLPNLKPEKLEVFVNELKGFNDLLANYWWIFLLLALVIGFISGLLGEKLQGFGNKKWSTTRITYMSIFVALSVMINTMRVGSFSFGGFPIIFAGYMLGPIPGFIVGAVADVVGFIVRPPAFSFNILFTLTSALTGLIPVLVSKLLGDKYPKFTFIKVLVGIFVGQMITTVILAPMFSVILYGGRSFWLLASKAFFRQILSIPVYALLITSVGDRITKVIKFDKEFI